MVSPNQDLALIAYKTLLNISDFLNKHLEGEVIWAKMLDMSFSELQDDFVAGRVSATDVLNHLNEIGFYAIMEEENVRKFIGEAIPPSKKKVPPDEANSGDKKKPCG